jgi:hypothetical protein
VKWMGIAALMAIVVNLNPYLTNTLTHGQPFYPVLGTDAPGRPTPDVLGTPANFQDKPWPASVLLSIFSESSWSVSNQPGKLKWPFLVTRGEVEAFGRGESVRSGGFGPLFAMTTLLGVWVFMRVRRPDVDRRDLLLLVALLAPTLAVPAWWARYVPQFWWVPLFGAWLLIRRGARPILPALVIAVAAANVGLVGYGAASFQYRMTKAIRADLTTLKTQGPVAVQLDLFASTGRRLTEARIDWRPLGAGEACSDRRYLIGSLDAHTCAVVPPRYREGSPF